MKTINIILAAFFIVATVSAQSTVKKSYNTSGINTLKGDFTWGDVKITNWDGDRVEVEASVSINNGENDDAFIIDSDQSGGTLNINTYIKDMDDLPKMVTIKHKGEKYYFKKEGDYKSKIRQLKKELGTESFNTYSNGVAVEIDLVIKVPSNLKLNLESTYGDIDLEKCSNAMDIHNTYGHINAVFDSRANLPEADLFSTYSFVDVSIPSNANLNIEMNTSYGSLFTDMDIDIDRSASKEKAFFNKVVGKINSGGTSLKLKATYNNVYLRKI